MAKVTYSVVGISSNGNIKTLVRDASYTKAFTTRQFRRNLYKECNIYEHRDGKVVRL